MRRLYVVQRRHGDIWRPVFSYVTRTSADALERRLRQQMRRDGQHPAGMIRIQIKEEATWTR